LPERWKRGRQRAALSALAALVLFTGALQGQGGAEQLGAWWLRARFSLRELVADKLHTQWRDPRIVLVEFDDKCSAAWPEPFPVWGGHIADGINQLSRSGARLIALDWTQTFDSGDYFRVNNDAKLGSAIAGAKSVVFVKFVGANGKYTLPTPALLFSRPEAVMDAGDSILGFADLPGESNIKSSFFPVLPPEKAGEPAQVSFAQRILERSGLKAVPGPPARHNGSVLINFANHTGDKGEAAPFERVSLFDLANAKRADPRWKDKIFIFGVSYKGNNDLHAVPFLNGFAGTREVNGMEVQANAVRTLLDGSAIEEPQGISVWSLAVLFGAVGIAALTTLSWGRAVRLLGLLLLVWTVLSFSVFCFAHYSLPLVLPFLSLLFGTVLMGSYRALSEERERAQVMKIWGRHQDPRLIDELLAHPEWRGGQGEEVEVTVLFADLKNFTKTVEHLSPQKALEALNRYLALLSSVILEHGGVVDKYLGDGLMAQWGTPAERPDHATAAVRACLEIEKRVAALTATLAAQNSVSFEVRLTLHTGPVVAGPLGSDQRLEYTIIGDTVNVTSRLQETAKALGCDFLISETTCAALRGAVRTGRETEVEIRGRTAPLKVFEVLDEDIHPPEAGVASGCENPNGQNVSK
jgi:adenylate cyclase